MQEENPSAMAAPCAASEHTGVTFTILKAPFIFPSSLFGVQSIWHSGFLDTVIWTNVSAEVFSVLWKYPPCGESSV